MFTFYLLCHEYKPEYVVVLSISSRRHFLVYSHMNNIEMFILRNKDHCKISVKLFRYRVVRWRLKHNLIMSIRKHFIIKSTCRWCHLHSFMFRTSSTGIRICKSTGSIASITCALNCTPVLSGSIHH